MQVIYSDRSAEGAYYVPNPRVRHKPGRCMPGDRTFTYLNLSVNPIQTYTR